MISENILILNQDLKSSNLKPRCQKYLNLKPICLKNSNLGPKCPSQNVLWLGVKLHGLRFDTLPKHIGLYILKNSMV
jgi:hypothetical protein